MRQQKGKVTMDNLQNELRAKLFVGSNENDALARLSEQQTLKAITLSITTRGIGIGICHLSYIAISYHTNIQIPSIYAFYRVSLGLLEAKLENIKKDMSVVPRYTEHCYQYRVTSDMLRVAQSVAIVPEPIKRIIDAVGHLTYEDKMYTPAVAAEVYDRRRQYVPRPEAILLSNLRNTVVALADPATPRAYRESFHQHSPIPGCIWQDDLLMNPNEIMPANYDFVDDFRRDSHLIAPYVASLQSIVQLAYPSEVTGNLVGCGSFIPHMVKWVPQTYQRGRVDQMRQQKGKVTMDNLQNELRAKLFVGSNENDALARLSEQQTLKAITLSITTRGIGIGICHLSYIAISYHTNIQIPSIYAFYRVSLGLLEAKLENIKKDMSVVPRYTEHCYQYRVTSDMLRVAQSVAIVPEPIKRIIDAVGHLTYEDKMYTPAVAAEPRKGNKRPGHQTKSRQTYQRGRVDQMRQQKGKVTMDNLQNELRAKLFVGSNENDALARLSEQQTLKAITLSITTRGIGIGICHLSYIAISYHTNIQIPSIYAFYRVSLGLLEAKLENIKKDMSVVPRYTEHCYQYRVTSDMLRVAQSVAIVPEPIKRIIDAVGHLTYEDKMYTPAVAAEVYDRRRQYVPRPEAILLSNLRNTVVALADPATPRAYRESFHQHSPIPGCIWQDDLLMNPNEIMPANYDFVDDFRRDSHLIAPYVASLQSIVQLAYPSEVTGNLVGCGSFIPHMVKWVPQTYQRGRVDQMRQQKGKVTMDNLQNELRAKLFVGSNENDALARLSEQQTLKAITLSITTRGIGIGICHLSYIAISYHTNIQIPSIYAFYRVSLGLLEAKLENIKKDMSVVPRYTEHCYQYRVTSDMLRVAQSVAIVPEPIKRIIDAVGHLTYEDKMYTPAVAAEVYDRRRQYVPRPEAILLSNLRNTVVALADPATPRAYRESFHQHSPIPGCIWQDDLLMNPNEIMPANYDFVDDFRRDSHLIAPYVASLQSIVQLAYPSEVTGNLVGCGSFIPHMVKWVPQTYQRGRVDQMRQQKGKVTMDNLQNELRAKLFVGSNENDALARLSEQQTLKAITLSITTRGIGIGICHLSYIAISYHTNIQIPSIYAFYRVSLGLLEAKLENIKKDMSVVPRYTEHCYQYRVTSDMLRVAQSVAIVPEPIKRIIDAVGHLTYEDKMYTPAVAAEVYDRRRQYVPRPEAILLSNLRNTVVALADPATPRAYRESFHQHSPIPGCIWQDDLLMNPNEIMPANYDFVDDFRRDSHLIAPYVASLQSIVQLAYPSEVTGNLVGCGSFIPHMVKWVPQTYQRGRVDQMRQQKGKVTMDNLQNELRAKLFVGSNENDALARLSEQQTLKAITLSITTRGIGIGICHLSYIAISYHTNIQIPSIYAFYRVSLGLLEAKLENIKKDMSVVPRYTEHCYQYRVTSDMLRVAQSVAIVPEPIKRIIDAVGHLTYEDKMYTPAVAAEVYDRRRQYVPRPEAILLSNLRNTVVALADPATPRAYHDQEVIVDLDAPCSEGQPEGQLEQVLGSHLEAIQSTSHDGHSSTEAPKRILPSDQMSAPETENIQLESKILEILDTDPTTENRYGKEIYNNVSTRFQYWVTTDLMFSSTRIQPFA
ncbi:unnamed protein product [Chilo suppressalis]|uniref:Uncharacterized protein n=1 Tax=Chilo suppressalis TaxID=168631 RepID=A0ABN8B9X2_CHISP|nr:unnamed protein product [Chilo suppressalis]